MKGPWEEYSSCGSFCLYRFGHGYLAVWKERTSLLKLDTLFAEVLLPCHRLDAFPDEAALWHETEAERQLRYQREDKKRQIIPLIMEIVEHHLTEMQRICIKLHFVCGKTRTETAHALGISPRVVTQHIYGIKRNGKRVGGGIKRIRSICKKRGISL